MEFSLIEVGPDDRAVLRRLIELYRYDFSEFDRSDVVVLGCAGMADMCSLISAELGVPVVDGVTAATLTVQSLVAMGLGTSKRGEYAVPPPKAYLTG